MFYILSTVILKNGENTMERKYYLSDLKESAIEELEDCIKWNKDNKENYELDDLIPEVADNNIPIYTYELLQYASNTLWLATEPNDLCSENADAIKVIQANIYEALTEALHEHTNETK